MIDGLKPYPKYKDSGVPWLGKVPEHWEVHRLKSSVAHINEQTNSKNPDELYIALEHVESWTGRLRAPSGDVEFDSQVKRFRAGDILFGKLRPYLAKVVRPEQDGVCVGEFFVLRPKYAVTPGYLEVVLRSPPAIDFVNSSTYGAKMPRADWTFVGGMPFPHPSIPEQTAIVRFLDWADQRIQRVIRARERRIKLLEEYKQALIHQAVTGQIDVRTGKPYPKYKDSGIEWLGEVPEHWKVSRVKTEFDCLNHRRIPLNNSERGTMTKQIYAYYGASGIIDKVDDYLFDGELLLIAEDGANLVLRNLPLAIVAHGKFWVNNHAHVLKPRRGNIYFLAYVMESLNYLPWISGAAQPKLTQDRLMSIAIAVPPREEQDFIMKWVEELFRPIKAVIAADHRVIDLLKEFRTRLIADVVTGKLDVRGYNVVEESDATPQGG